MASRRSVDGQLAAAHALGRTALHPDVTRVLNQYKSLTDDEERARFANHFLGRTAGMMDEIWPIFYQLLKVVEDGELWRKPDYVGGGQGRVYESFRDYFEERVGRPFSTWAELEDTYRYAHIYKPELFDESLAEATAARMAALDGKAIKDRSGPRTKEEKDNPHNIRVTDGDYGTSADYLTRRIKRDHPDIADRMKNGEYKSVRQAALDAGIIHPTTTIRTDDPHAIEHTLRRQLKPDILRQLTKLLTEET